MCSCICSGKDDFPCKDGLCSLGHVIKHIMSALPPSPTPLMFCCWPCDCPPRVRPAQTKPAVAQQTPLSSAIWNCYVRNKKWDHHLPSQLIPACLQPSPLRPALFCTTRICVWNQTKTQREEVVAGRRGRGRGKSRVMYQLSFRVAHLRALWTGRSVKRAKKKKP